MNPNRHEFFKGGRSLKKNGAAQGECCAYGDATAQPPGLFLLFAFSFLLFLGCTVTPKIVRDSKASFDGSEQNSGLIGFTQGGAILTPHARDRYNGLISIYGTNFIPALTFDAGITPTTTNTFIIDNQHLVDFGKMNTWRKGQPHP